MVRTGDCMCFMCLLMSVMQFTQPKCKSEHFFLSLIMFFFSPKICAVLWHPEHFETSFTKTNKIFSLLFRFK